MEEKYESLKELGSGSFGVARLVRDNNTKELFAVKFIERGKKIDENVQREIINHRSLRHPNIVRFKEVLLTPTHLAIVMEYAAEGELFARIKTGGRFSEDEARYFFQQLISGVSCCHSKMVVNDRRHFVICLKLMYGRCQDPRTKFYLRRCATETSSWRIIFWMESLHHALKFVTLFFQSLDCYIHSPNQQ